MNTLDVDPQLVLCPTCAFLPELGRKILGSGHIGEWFVKPWT